MVLALGVAVGVAWYAGWLPTGDDPNAQQSIDGKGKTGPKRELGAALYDYPPPAQRVLKDTPGGRGIPFYDCHLVAVETMRQEAGPDKDGRILFYGEEVDQESPVAVKGLPTARIFVGGKVREVTYRPLKEGDYVVQNQVVAMIDPTKAANDIDFKAAKIVAAKADYLAAIAMHKEAQARLERLEALQRKGPGLVSAEEFSAAVLTRDKHREEEVSKREAVKLTEIDLYQAQAELRMHEVRCVIPGTSVVKQIYKNVGDVVKTTDPIMSLVNVSRLRAEGAVEAQYSDRLKAGQTVVVEPIHETTPYQGRPLKAHRAEVNGVAAAADGSFVSGSEDQTVCVWRRNDKGDYTSLELLHDHPVRAVACSPPASKQNLCAAGLGDGHIVLWDLSKTAKLDQSKTPNLAEARVRELKDGHRDSVTALAFSPDGKWFASGGQDNRIVLWETATGKKLYAFDAEHGVETPHQGTITALTFTPQGKLISSARDNSIRVWALHVDGAAQEGAAVVRRSGSVAVPGVSADGKLMVYDQGRTLQLRSVQDRQRVAVLETTAAATQFETLALFSPDGSLLLTAGAPEGKMQLWRIPSPGTRGFEVRQLVTVERSPVTCAAFGLEGSLKAVSGTKSGDVYVWDVPSPEQVENHCIVVNRDGRPLTLTNRDMAVDAGKIRIWVGLDNQETQEAPTAEYPRGRIIPRLIPGQRVTVVIQP
jgi:WD40 repeat protein